MRLISGGAVAGTNVKGRNTRAKRANLPEGRGAKPQVQNGQLGCRLEKNGNQVLFGGESLKSLFFKRHDREAAGPGKKGGDNRQEYANRREYRKS
jgi:hypothetical protein